ncbi:unnamed protein product [Arabis nemorensis]|uniref:Uncharacterized protein n=1 Tax=Arabis nemorensis TaxID=586526 RepID=A0A565AMB5_9BRAS|nr:unnamed protein product [Arabis nemorensis]
MERFGWWLMTKNSFADLDGADVAAEVHSILAIGRELLALEEEEKSLPVGAIQLWRRAEKE